MAPNPVRCARCDALWPVTSPRVRRRPDTRWACVSTAACEARRADLLARTRAALEAASVVLERIRALPDELVQAGRR